MLTGLLRVLARLPLSWLHAAGASLGWLIYLSTPAYSSRLRENLRRSRVWKNDSEFTALLHANIAEAGKATAELPAIWFRPQAQTASWVRSVYGWECVEAARAARRGLILLTPHLGCFEVISQYLALRFALTVLYRPPRFRALEPAMRAGRTRSQLHLASTDIRGVRTLLKALKRGEAVGILPDQVPSAGEGEWAEFFGRPAYTMTLASRLADSARAPIIVTYAVRLAHGRGYDLNFEPITERDANETAGRHLNRALESVISRCPQQYLWSYNRYKVPAGAGRPSQTAAMEEQR